MNGHNGKIIKWLGMKPIKTQEFKVELVQDKTINAPINYHGIEVGVKKVGNHLTNFNKFGESLRPNGTIIV